MSQSLLIAAIRSGDEVLRAWYLGFLAVAPPRAGHRTVSANAGTISEVVGGVPG